MKVKRLMASLLCGAIGAATLGLSGCGSAADSGMMDAANANAVAGGSSDLPVVTWKMGSTWGDGTSTLPVTSASARMQLQCLTCFPDIQSRSDGTV